MTLRSSILALWLLLAAVVMTAAEVQSDTIPTSDGDLVITFIGHGSLLFELGETVVYVDPWGRLANYSRTPKADLILLTHDHPDHLDQEAIAALRTDREAVVMTRLCADRLGAGTVLGNGEETTVKGIRIQAVPAYNLVHTRPSGEPFHPRGAGNGYVLTFGDTRVYVAGDTENVPEMKALEDIDIAFLPMNLPYTMTPEMVADAARAFRPRILYPYHFGQTDPALLVALLAAETDIEVRIRELS